jgi:uncharacterized protein YdiU (UPF0061 family)
MQKSNPRIILKNYMLEEIIREAEKEKYEPCREMLKLI